MRFGVNYIPSKNWLFCFSDWDEKSVDAELTAIAGIGMDHIRVHCLWSVFQYGQDCFNETAIGNLSRLLTLAEAHGLDVVVSALDGFMSDILSCPLLYTSSMKSRSIPLPRRS